jgi:hypothetical protein
MSRYGGGLSYRELAGAQNDPLIAKMCLEQLDTMKKACQGWHVERREALQKFRKEVTSLQRVRDGINEFLVLKNGFTPSQREKIESEFNGRAVVANTIMRDLVEDYRQKMVKVGVTTATGYVFFDLRGPAFLAFPVNVPLRNSFPRWGRENAGVGTAVRWKYTGFTPALPAATAWNQPTPVTSSAYAGASEGNRVAPGLPPETDAAAFYKEFGVERSITFTAEVAAEGYTNMSADEHVRGLFEMFLQEESLIIGGNSGIGVGNNGFALGTANAPSVSIQAAAGTPNDGGAGFANGTNVSVRVVELTMLGNPNNAQYGYQAAPTVASGTGLSPSWNRANADASQDTIYGGMGAVSASSAVVQATTPKPFVYCYVKPKPGAVAWAWYVDVTDSSSPTAANAVLGAITTVPFVTLGQAGAGTQTAAATGLNADNSQQPLDFDGLIAWAVKAGRFVNMADATSVSPVTGLVNTGYITQGMAGATGAPGVMEIDYDLEQQFLVFQATADMLHMSPDARHTVSACLLKPTTGAIAAAVPYQFNIEPDEQGEIKGGFAVTGYVSQYTMDKRGGVIIPIRTHTMLPPGTILYDRSEVPYPESRLPGVRGIFTQRDYYSIEWEPVSRKRVYGTYGQQVLGHYIPGLLTVRTGIIGTN